MPLLTELENHFILVLQRCRALGKGSDLIVSNLLNVVRFNLKTAVEQQRNKGRIFVREFRQLTRIVSDEIKFAELRAIRGFICFPSVAMHRRCRS
jgi:hypothetical protein